MKLEDVILGDVLMLFDGQKHSIGGATNHTLTVSPEYTEISCKDAGIYGWKKLNKINWEIQSENLWIKDDYKDYLDKTLNDDEFTVYFGQSNWDENGLAASPGHWTPETVSGSSSDYEFLYKGKVKISSLTLNAPSGDNATYSVTFTGVGPLESVSTNVESSQISS